MLKSYTPEIESLEARRLLAADCTTACEVEDFQNHLNIGDVNADGVISQIDALIIINALNSISVPPPISVPRGEHLFVLSGQSNMERLDYRESFLPALTSAYEGDVVKVVKEAQGGKPIRDWYKDWETLGGEVSEETGLIYDRLLSKIDLDRIDPYATITFVWVQGERDANEGYGDIYEASLLGLIDQLKTDLNRDDINVVLGRLSDFNGHVDWQEVRLAQENVAADNFWATYVNTDDLNDYPDSPNDLHYTPEGYFEFGLRLADAAVHLNEVRHREVVDRVLTDDLRPIADFWENGFPDVNFDGYVTPMDALNIINSLGL